MPLVNLKDLDRCLTGALAEERLLSITIDGTEFGAPGDYVVGVLNLRNRVFQLDLSKRPNFPTGGPQWNPADTKIWSETWRAVLTCIGILAPRIDPTAFLAILRTEEHLCLIADTGAAASGIVAWLCFTLWNRRIELVLNSVVERELFGWSDQQDFHAKELAHWKSRVIYRLARRLSETPPPNLIVRRPAPEEKAALMLAKVKLPGIKSPDADILLIEQARDVLPTQPPSVRTLYVTTDRNHARSAVAILPPKNVLFAPPAQFDVTQPIFGMAAFWQPAAGFGALRPLSIAEMVWCLLAITSKVVLTGPSKQVEIRNVLYDNGCPTDWVDPQFEVLELAMATSAPYQGTPSALAQNMLLAAPMAAGAPVAPAALRASPAALVAYFNMALAGESVAVPVVGSEGQRDGFQLLFRLGLFQDNGDPVSSHDLLRAIKDNDWDSVHSQFLRLPAYEAALSSLRTNSVVKPPDRIRKQLAIARHLGQAAAVETGGPVLAGDHPLAAPALIAFLEDVLSVPGTDYAVADVCVRALMELGVTPARFEKALQRLLNLGYNGVSLETGGSVGKGVEERVFHYNGSDVVEDLVSMAALYFGGDRPIKSLRRHR